MHTQILTKEVVILSPQHPPVTLDSPSQRRFSERQIRRSILRILEGNVLCSMSTVTKDIRAHINTAYFCYCEDLELYFLSDPSSLHCRNLSTNSSMAMTIFSSSQKWTGPDRGMQLFGTCKEARGYQAMKAERWYGNRFPQYRQWKTGQGKDDQLRAFRYRFYRFVPGKVKILDEREFGGGVFVTAAVRRVQDSN